jgi:site-specific DNA recombinase
MKAPATAKQAAIYSRISHEDQSAYSLPSQRLACLSLAAAKGYQTSDEFTFIDNGGLSTELDRPGLARLREAVRAGMVGAVVIYSLDRLSRKVVHQLLLLEEFERAGVEVLFVDAPADSSPEGRMLLQIKGLFGEYEREKIRERTVRGSRQRAKEGKINSRPPYGYTATDAGLLVPHPARLQVVKTIFSRIIQGMTCGDIAASLNCAGVPAPLRERWVRGTVLQIARRDAYYSGQLAWNKRTAAEPLRRRKPARPGKSKQTSLKLRPETDWIRIAIPPLIDRATFDAAQRALESNRRAKGGRPSETYLLTGLLRCGRCGAAVCGSYSHGHPYYKCSGTDSVTGKRNCKERSVRLDSIEPMIWSDAVTTVTDEAKLARLYSDSFAETNAMESDHAAERADLVERVEKLKRREFRARQAMLDSDLADSYASFRNDLKATIQQRQTLERRLESIAPAQPPVKPENFIEFCSRMERAWGITDRGEQREFLRACVEEIRLTRDEVNIRFSVNVAAAMAAIGPDSNSATNCQLRLGLISHSLGECCH